MLERTMFYMFYMASSVGYISFKKIFIFFEPFLKSDSVNKLDNYAIYLRRFESDVENIKKNRNNYIKNGIGMPEPLEQALGEMITDMYVKTISIGYPKYPVKTLISSLCIYIPDINWKDSVRQLIDNSKLIILKVANTESCIWEMEYCFSNHFFNKTLFIVDSNQSLSLLARYIDFKKNYTINNGQILIVGMVGEYMFEDFISKEKDLERLLKVYLLHNEDCLWKNYCHTIRYHLFKKEKIPARLWQYISFILAPALYIAYNNWSFGWGISLLVYYILLFISSFYFYGNLNYYIFMLGSIPWLFIIPKISYWSKNWGGDYMFEKCQKSLAFWSFLLIVPVIMIDYCF